MAAHKFTFNLIKMFDPNCCRIFSDPFLLNASFKFVENYYVEKDQVERTFVCS